MTTVRIAHTEPWPGQRMGGRGFRISSFLVVLADDAGGRAFADGHPGVLAEPGQLGPGAAAFTPEPPR